MVVSAVMWAIISPTHLNSTYQNPKQAIRRLCDGGFMCDWCRNLKCIITSTVWAVYRYTKRLFSSLSFSYTSYNLIPLLFCIIFCLVCLFLVLFVFFCFSALFCYGLLFCVKNIFCTFVLLFCFWCLFSFVFCPVFCFLFLIFCLLVSTNILGFCFLLVFSLVLFFVLFSFSVLVCLFFLFVCLNKCFGWYLFSFGFLSCFVMGFHFVLLFCFVPKTNRKFGNLQILETRV